MRTLLVATTSTASSAMNEFASRISLMSLTPLASFLCLFSLSRLVSLLAAASLDLLCLCLGVFVCSFCCFRSFFFLLNCGKCSNLCLSRLHTWLLVCCVYERFMLCVFFWCLFVFVWAHVHKFTYLYNQIDPTSHFVHTHFQQETFPT